MFWEKGQMCIKTDILVFSKVSHKEESTTPKTYRNDRHVCKYILEKREEMENVCSISYPNIKGCCSFDGLKSDFFSL